MLFVGDILQLPPVNGAPVFERITNKSIATKLGCTTSVNIWQDTVHYDELMINECHNSVWCSALCWMKCSVAALNH